MAEVIAKLRYLRMSPRKTRLVADLVRGAKATDAVSQLEIMPRAAARPVLKLLNSAIANAEHNFKLDKKSLFIKTIFVDRGPMLKRSKPRAMGRATPIHRHTSHVTIILEAAGGLPKAKGVKSAVVKSEAAPKVVKAAKTPKAAAAKVVAKGGKK